MKRLSYLWVTGLIAFALLFGGVGYTNAKENIKIGFVIGITGKYAGGELPLVNGVKMAVEEINNAGGINGRKIDLIIEDTGSEQHGAVNAFNRVVSQNPVAIMNTTLSTFTFAQTPAMKKAAIPALGGPGNPKLTQQNNPWFFRIRTSDKYVPIAATKFILDELGKKKIGILRVNDEYGEGWEEAIVSVLNERGLKPAGIEVHAATDKDMTPQLIRLKKADSEALIVSSHPTTHALIMRQRKQLGMDIPQVHSNAAALPHALKLVSPEESEGIYATVDSLPAKDPNPQITEWAKRYRKKFKMQSDFSSAEYYDGVMMLADAIKAKGTDANAIRDYFLSINDRQGMGNYWSFDETGEGGSQVMIVVFKNGAPEAVKKLLVR